MKVRKRVKLDSPIYATPGYDIRLTYVDAEGNRHLCMQEPIEREMWLTHAVVLDIEEGDFDGATEGIGGAFLSQPGA